MRLSNSLIASTVTRNIFNNTDSLFRIQNRISSGLRITRPSDDPIGAGLALGYRQTLCAIGQYERNILHGESWLNIADASLATVDELLIHAKELAVGQATETSTAQTRAIAAEEVKNIYEQLVQMANTKVGSSYIFAGHKTTTQPFSYDSDYNISYNGRSETTAITANGPAGLEGTHFTLNSVSGAHYVWYTVDGVGVDPAPGGTGIQVDLLSTDTAAGVATQTAAAIDAVAEYRATASGAAVTVVTEDGGRDVADAVDNTTGFSLTTTVDGNDGDDGDISISIGENVEMTINFDGREIFLEEIPIFNIIRDLKDGLETNDTVAISAQIERLDSALGQILDTRANIGAKLNRLESTRSYWEGFEIHITELLSATEDADIAEELTALQSQQTAYEAALAASANLLQTSLIDFIR